MWKVVERVVYRQFGAYMEENGLSRTCRLLTGMVIPLIPLSWNWLLIASAADHGEVTLRSLLEGAAKSVP